MHFARHYASGVRRNLSCGCKGASQKYEGRSVNKLQNGIILLIFRLWKFRNIHFVGNLILSTSCEFYYDDVTVTSFINIGYGTLPLKSSHKEQPSVLFVCCGQKDLVQMPFSLQMCPVYGDKYFTRPAIHVWCKKFAHGRKSAVDEERPGRRVVATTDATITAVDSLMRSNQSHRLEMFKYMALDQTGVWCGKRLYEFWRYAEKWNTNVWRLNTFACWTCSPSRLTHNAVQHLRVAK